MITEFLENEGAREFYKQHNEGNIKYISEEQIILWINNYVSKERLFYDFLMKGEQKKEFTNINKIRDNYVELCQSTKFYKFLKIAMKCRDIHRKREAGI